MGLKLEDLVTSLVVGISNHALANGAQSVSDIFSELPYLKLAEGNTLKTPIWFIDSDGSKIAFDEWLSTIFELDIERAVVARIRSRKGEGLEEFPTPILRGASNVPPYGPALIGRDGMAYVYQLKIHFGDPTDMTKENIVDFVNKQDQDGYLESRMLWQNEHNLRICKTNDYQTFIEAIPESKVARVVEALNVSVWNINTPPEIMNAWEEFYEAHRIKDRVEAQVVSKGIVPARMLNAPQNLGAAKRHLASSLTAIKDFAKRVGGLNQWVERFETSLAALAGKGDSEFIQFAGLDRYYSAGGLDLLRAASAAEVFGRAGTWNDVVVSPEYEKEYARLSHHLLRAKDKAFLTGCNQLDWKAEASPLRAVAH